MNDPKTQETTQLYIDYSGNYVTWAWCENCGMPVQYPTEYPYNHCPYCGLKIIHKKEEKK